MSGIPHASLTDTLKQRIDGRRIVSALFVTYSLEPAFFEQEVVPVLFDESFSHAGNIRLLQLEDLIRNMDGEIAVYYDALALMPLGNGSAKLDIRRVPVLHRGGAAFHPKNILLVLERSIDGIPHRSLLLGCMSANLTRRGWWENVEVAHFEEIEEGAKSALRDGLIDFLDSLRRRALAGDQNESALSDVLSFLRRRVESRAYRSRSDVLYPQFYSGREPVDGFLATAAGSRLNGLNLEVISPFFDDSRQCAPLERLLERFNPREVRVHLPVDSDDMAACSKDQYEAVIQFPRTSWGHLPPTLTRAGAGEIVATRSVHAKVYRFFSRNPPREIFLVGSPNLTTAAHTASNFETAVLVENPNPKKPDFWLVLNDHRPRGYSGPDQQGEEADFSSIPLAVRFNWETSRADVMWLPNAPSPALSLSIRGVGLCALPSLSPHEWLPLAPEAATTLRAHLDESSFVLVSVADDEGLVLVQEESMSHKPSLLFRLSVAEILRYWAMLTPAQRNAFLDLRWGSAFPIGDGSDLISLPRIVYPKDTLFDRFAGVFHSFAALEHHVTKALSEEREREADYRLFGRKYDSLPTLLEHLAGDEAHDPIDRYVITKCADQIVSELRRSFPEFFALHHNDLATLMGSIRDLSVRLRHSLCDEHAGVESFLDWFDPWFMKKAKPLEEMND